MSRFTIKRRTLLCTLAGLPGLRLLVSPMPVHAQESAAGRDVIKELEVRSFINAAGTFTALTGSLMRPEVVQAMQVAARKFVQLDALQLAVGKRIAQLVDCQAAMVTSGCAFGALARNGRLRCRQRPVADQTAAGHNRHEERGRRPADPPGQL